MITSCLQLIILPSELGNLPDVVNDLDVDFTENMVASNRYQHDARNIRKVQEATKALQVNIIHPLRQGKKLLVLDIDYSWSANVFHFKDLNFSWQRSWIRSH